MRCFALMCPILFFFFSLSSRPFSFAFHCFSPIYRLSIISFPIKSSLLVFAILIHVCYHVCSCIRISLLTQFANVNGMTLDCEWARCVHLINIYFYCASDLYIIYEHIDLFIYLSGVFNHSKTLSLAQLGLMSTWVGRLLACLLIQ